MVEPLAASDSIGAARVLARAFRDSPGMVAVLCGGTPDERVRMLEPCMLGFVEGVLRYGVAEVVREGAEVRAVALAFPPGAFPPPLWFDLTTAMGPLRTGI